MTSRTKWMLIWTLVVVVAAILLLAVQKWLEWFPFWLGVPLLSLAAVAIYTAIYYLRTYRKDYEKTRQLLRNEKADKHVELCLFFLPFVVSLLIVLPLLGLLLAGQDGIDKATRWLASPAVQFSILLTLILFMLGDYKAQEALQADSQKWRQYSNNLHYLDVPFVVTASVLFLFDVAFDVARYFQVAATPEQWDGFLATWPAFLGGATAFQLLAQNTAFVWVTHTPSIHT